MSDKQKIIIQFWRCDWDNCRELKITEEAWAQLVTMLENAGCEVIAEEQPYPIPREPDIHRTRRILNSVAEVQGLKFVEGESALAAIESLVAKYAELK